MISDRLVVQFAICCNFNIYCIFSSAEIFPESVTFHRVGADGVPYKFPKYFHYRKNAVNVKFLHAIQMINTIIFDFGDIFVNLDKKGAMDAFSRLGLTELNQELNDLNGLFEKGQISEEAFLNGFQKFLPDASTDEIRSAWNQVIGDFPLERLEFLQMLTGKYRLFLLTNTDQIHIAHFEETVGATFPATFTVVSKRSSIPMNSGCANQTSRSSTTSSANTTFLQNAPCSSMTKRKTPMRHARPGFWSGTYRSGRKM